MRAATSKRRGGSAAAVLDFAVVLTEMHGGHVEVDSTLGRGSTFSAYLPGGG